MTAELRLPPLAHASVHLASMGSPHDVREEAPDAGGFFRRATPLRRRGARSRWPQLDLSLFLRSAWLRWPAEVEPCPLTRCQPLRLGTHLDGRLCCSSCGVYWPSASDLRSCGASRSGTISLCLRLRCSSRRRFSAVASPGCSSSGEVIVDHDPRSTPEGASRQNAGSTAGAFRHSAGTATGKTWETRFSAAERALLNP